MCSSKWAGYSPGGKTRRAIDYRKKTLELLIYIPFIIHRRLPMWLSGKESACSAEDKWVPSLGQEIPWEKKWQPTPVFLPGESHGQRSLVGYNPQGCKRVGHNLATKQQQQLCTWLLALGPSSNWVLRLRVSRKSPAFWKRTRPVILAGPKGESISNRGL